MRPTPLLIRKAFGIEADLHDGDRRLLPASILLKVIHVGHCVRTEFMARFFRGSPRRACGRRSSRRSDPRGCFETLLGDHVAADVYSARNWEKAFR